MGRIGLGAMAMVRARRIGNGWVRAKIMSRIGLGAMAMVRARRIGNG